MISAGLAGDLLDRPTLQAATSTGKYRDRNIGNSTSAASIVTELAEVVISPGIHRAVAGQCH